MKKINLMIVFSGHVDRALKDCIFGQQTLQATVTEERNFAYQGIKAAIEFHVTPYIFFFATSRMIVIYLP